MAGLDPAIQLDHRVKPGDDKMSVFKGETMTRRSIDLSILLLAMITVVVASNKLVQYPVEGHIGALNLADILTWGAFSYPFAFLVTDLTNRSFGPSIARRLVLVGFAIAVVLSIYFASPRLAIASGTAFLVGQLLDVTVFNRLRNGVWWAAPWVASVLGSIVDTAIFFSLAFAPTFAFLGANDPFSLEMAPLFGVMASEAPRFASWALGDLSVKLIIAVLALAPYRLLMNRLMPWRPVAV
jgi:queuosine precursor transporter